MDQLSIEDYEIIYESLIFRSNSNITDKYRDKLIKLKDSIKEDILLNKTSKNEFFSQYPLNKAGTWSIFINISAGEDQYEIFFKNYFGIWEDAAKIAWSENKTLSPPRVTLIK